MMFRFDPITQEIIVTGTLSESMFNTHDGYDAIYNSGYTFMDRPKMKIEYVGCFNETPKKENVMNTGLELIGMIAIGLIAVAIVIFITHLIETIFEIGRQVESNARVLRSNNSAIAAIHRKLPSKKSKGKKGRK